MSAFFPKRGVAYQFYMALFQQASPGSMKANPTLAAGDVKISKDGGATANLTTLPAATPAAGNAILVSVSATEMTADDVTIAFVDAAGAEWMDAFVHIQPQARALGDLAFPATSGRSMVVDASGLVDANTVSVGATGAGTAQTARDLGASVLLSVGAGTGQVNLASGLVRSDVLRINNTVQTAADVGALVATVGTPAGASVSADVAAVKAVDDAIKAKTDNLPAAPASTTNITGGTITTVTNLTNAPTAGDLTATMKTSVTTAATAATPTAAAVTGNVGGNVVGSVGSVAAGGITAASVATDAIDADALSSDAITEIVNGVLAGTITELSAIPAASPTLKQAIGLLFMALRNKVAVTATSKKVHNDADSVLATKTLADDGTTYSETKMA